MAYLNTKTAIMASTEITELATIIAENTNKIDKYLAEQNLPSPSFNVDGPSKSMIPPEAKDIETARVAVIEATQKLRNLMLGPSDYLMSFQVSHSSHRATRQSHN